MHENRMMTSYCHPNILSFLSSHSSVPHIFLLKCDHYLHRRHLIISRSIRRHHRRRRHLGNPAHSNPSSSPPQFDQSLQVVINVQNLSNKASLSIGKLLGLSESKLGRFVQSYNDAVDDLRTMISFDSDKRVVLSCRGSTVRFFGGLIVWGFLALFLFRVLVRATVGIRDRFGLGHRTELIWRRDRSLGGREVIVGRREDRMNQLVNPLVRSLKTVEQVSARIPRGRMFKIDKKLPNWWPVLLPTPAYTDNKEEYQRIANRLVRVILDNRVSGRDILENDIIQLRRLCRTSGVRVSINTENARDSIYRASVDFVLNICCRQSPFVLIDGEDARQFIAGLANNIGIESIRAANMVSAAVAARTKLYFLQAWALEMQSKHSESVMELSKICVIHQMFPPEESSPEMEMVALGLEKHLNAEQREHLRKMLNLVCGQQVQRSVNEALGIMPSAENVGNQQ